MFLGIFHTLKESLMEKYHLNVLCDVSRNELHYCDGNIIHSCYCNDINLPNQLESHVSNKVQEPCFDGLLGRPFLSNIEGFKQKMNNTKVNSSYLSVCILAVSDAASSAKVESKPAFPLFTKFSYFSASVFSS